MIVYEDDYILIVNKPNDVIVHHSSMARNVASENSLITLLYLEYGHEKIYPIHRLDRKTSGCILFAKDKLHISELQALFVNNQIKKSYLALVRGHLKNNGIIDSPVKGRDANVYKEAFTQYTTRAIAVVDIPVEPYKQSRYSLVTLQPQTGRLHQLRIHMNKISHPIIGDPKYGDRFHNRMFLEKFGIKHLFLHAERLTFYHPFLKKNIDIQAPLPLHWETVLKTFKFQDI